MVLGTFSRTQMGVLPGRRDSSGTSPLIFFFKKLDLNGAPVIERIIFGCLEKGFMWPLGWSRKIRRPSTTI